MSWVARVCMGWSAWQGGVPLWRSSTVGWIWGALSDGVYPDVERGRVVVALVSSAGVRARRLSSYRSSSGR